MSIDKTDTWIEVVDDLGNTIEAFHWPFCVKEGCANRICLGVSTMYCHPHSAGKAADKLIKNLNEPIKETT